MVRTMAEWRDWHLSATHRLQLLRDRRRQASTHPLQGRLVHPRTLHQLGYLGKTGYGEELRLVYPRSLHQVGHLHKTG